MVMVWWSRLLWRRTWRHLLSFDGCGPNQCCVGTEAVPITETDMVGSILQDQEMKDREEYVFLTMDDADMGDVCQQLDSLTGHSTRLSNGVQGGDGSGQ